MKPRKKPQRRNPIAKALRIMRPKVKPSAKVYDRRKPWRCTLMTMLIEQIKAGIADGSLLQADVLRALSEAGTSGDFTGHIETAREGTNDELEIDDCPLVSESDDGVWVSAWVWVCNCYVPGYEGEDEEVAA